MLPLLIYTPRETPRLTYILRFFFGNLVGIDFDLTHNKEDFLRSKQPVLNYSHAPLNKGIWILNHSLLFDEGMTQTDPVPGRWKDMPVLFQTGAGPDLPFDPLAGSFYLLTRFEEYFPFKPDEYYRFPATESLAYREGFLEVPVIDLWAQRLRNILRIRYPELVFRKRKYRFILSVDVDQAWAYRNKGLIRNLGGGLKFLLQADFNELADRFGTLLGNRRDPFDSFEYLQNVFQKYPVNPIFFFQIGHYGKFDKNVSGKYPAMQNLIRKVQSFAKVGIHPSFRSNDYTKILTMEMDLMKTILQKKPSVSRQHYIRFRIPKTYRNLISSGIRGDYSMGFPEAVGFRAGTATPFPFYDLGEEQETCLTVYPFQVMDSCLNFTLKQTPGQAIETINQMIAKIKSVQGTFIPLWHNSSLHNHREWAGWRQVFEEMLKEGNA